jgi:hypothetical protein
MITTIYLDMDDVLCDFSNTYNRVMERNLKAMTPEQWDEQWVKWVDGQYFVTQPMLAGANQLLGYIAALGVKTEILSSTGGPNFYDEIVAQKRKWLDRWGIYYHPNFVPGKKFKSEFATPHRLLVDDQKGIIQKFCDAGGYGICHEGDMDNTIERLDTLIKLLGYKKYVAP